MIDVMELYPNAVEVAPQTIKSGDRVALLYSSESVESLHIFEVVDQRSSQWYLTARDGGTFKYHNCLAYVIPPELPTEPGSMIRNVHTLWGAEPFASGTLLESGIWYLVSTNGVAGTVPTENITTFEVV